MHASRAERYTAPGAVQVVDARARHKGVLLLDVRPVEAPRESPAGLPWTDRRSEAVERDSACRLSRTHRSEGYGVHDSGLYGRCVAEAVTYLPYSPVLLLPNTAASLSVSGVGTAGGARARAMK